MCLAVMTYRPRERAELDALFLVVACTNSKKCPYRGILRHELANMTTRLRVALAVVAAAMVLGLSFGPIVAHFAAGRVRAAAAARGLTVSWRKLTVSGLGRVRISGIVAARTGAAGTDSLFQADSLAVAPDLGSLLSLRPRVGSLGLWHAQIRLPA